MFVKKKKTTNPELAVETAVPHESDIELAVEPATTEPSINQPLPLLPLLLLPKATLTSLPFELHLYLLESLINPPSSSPTNVYAWASSYRIAWAALKQGGWFIINKKCDSLREAAFCVNFDYTSDQIGDTYRGGKDRTQDLGAWRAFQTRVWGKNGAEGGWKMEKEGEQIEKG